jgi:Bacteriophage tail sheath protein
MRFGHPDHGITVTEIAPMDQPVAVRLNTTPAFIGRALRGPLDTPVLIESLAAYTRRFGEVWHRSSLSQAVEQFFAHGGRRLYVVRVANNAYGASLRLPCSEGELLLSAAEPGSTEVLRAAVDYDGIDDDEHFNLIVQRLSPQNGLIVDQEIFEKISCDPESTASIVDALQDSAIVELNLPLPASRPIATMGKTAESRTPYVKPAERGGDGGELCDYDLIGSAVRGTGLFSLDDVSDLDLLYLPPPTADREPGPTAMLAAELYCRKRGAMLIVDPPAVWADARDAAAGIRHAGFASCNIVSYFPRIRISDRSQPAGGALAGLLCKMDAQEGPWSTLSGPQYALNRRIKAEAELDEAEQRLLQRAGFNVIVPGEGGRLQLSGDVTLGSGGQSDRQYASLPVRRLCLFIGKAIESATRWAIFDADRAHALQRVQYQVDEYMAALAAAGAFADEQYSVQCDLQRDSRAANNERGLTVLLTFTPASSVQPLSLTLYQTVSGSRIASTAFAPVAEACA